MAPHGLPLDRWVWATGLPTSLLFISGLLASADPSYCLQDSPPTTLTPVTALSTANLLRSFFCLQQTFMCLKTWFQWPFVIGSMQLLRFINCHFTLLYPHTPYTPPPPIAFFHIFISLTWRTLPLLLPWFTPLFSIHSNCYLCEDFPNSLFLNPSQHLSQPFLLPALSACPRLRLISYFCVPNS